MCYLVSFCYIHCVLSIICLTLLKVSFIYGIKIIMHLADLLQLHGKLVISWLYSPLRTMGTTMTDAHSSPQKIKILWRNRPMWEVMKFRNLKERDYTIVAERCRILLLLPSPLFALRVARLRSNYWVMQQ
jgi:hypothetical protein